MKEDLYIQLIYKELSGDISPEENKQLHSWIAEKDEHSTTYQAVRLAWESSDQAMDIPDIDLDNEFGTLEKRIANEASKTNSATIKKMEPPKRTWLKIAASLAVLLFAGYLFRNIGSSSPQMVIVEAFDEIKTIALPDGSNVTLNKNSSLIYPDKMNGDTREVELQGEAFFDVKKDPSKRFLIEVTPGIVEVLGTSFNVREDEQEIKVDVKTGTVSWKTKQGKQAIILEAGTTMKWNKYTAETNTYKNSANNAGYWIKNELHFNDQSLYAIASELENIFDVNLELGQLSQCNFSSSFKDLNLDNILETIAVVFGAQVQKIDDRQYRLEGGACQ